MRPIKETLLGRAHVSVNAAQFCCDLCKSYGWGLRIVRTGTLGHVEIELCLGCLARGVDSVPVVTALTE